MGVGPVDAGGVDFRTTKPSGAGGSSISRRTSTSGPPNSVIWIARTDATISTGRLAAPGAPGTPALAVTGSGPREWLGIDRGRAHRLTVPNRRPIAWKPPSTWRISPVIPRERSESRKARRRRPGTDRRRPSPAAPARPQRSARSLKPGMPLAATVSSGPAETRLTRMPRGPEVARQVARDRLERRLRDAHPVVGRPGDRGVEVEPDDAAPPPPSRSDQRRQRPARP